ncbi:MAG: type I-E CRISPR-associated protein Cse1/CasA [Ruminococcus sp.]|nr:type I-E CRISPR-associated protein Cse1/CasA [Ruminococcus sp.]
MKETDFNLLDEPWIRVMDESCSVRELSLTDVLIHAHEYKSLCGELPTQDVAVLRLLLAVLHTVFARVDAQGNPHQLEDEEEAVNFWHELWKLKKLPEQPIHTYLNQWHEHFWLFHPERPFAQVAGLTYGTSYEAAKLNGEISESSNKKRLFSSYFGAEKDGLTYAQAARWVLYLNAYDDTSAKPTKEGKAAAGGELPSPGAGWLGKLGLVYLCGNNLFETLLLNLVLVNQGEVQNRASPIWEREVMPSRERVEIIMADNLAELYTLQSRRILLKRSEDRVVSYLLLGGDFFEKENAFFEPMTIWNVPKPAKNKPTIYTPKRHDSSKQMWREFAVLYEHSDDKIAGVVRWFREFLADVLERSYVMKTAIASVQYGDKDFFVKHIHSDFLTLHAGILSELGKSWRKDILNEITKCEKLANAVGNLAKHLHIAEGGSDNSCESAVNTVKEQLYYRLDMPFREWLCSIDPDAEGEEKEKLLEQWQKTAQKIAFRYAQEQCEHASDAAMTGHLIGRDDKKKVLYSAPNAKQMFRGEVSKIYQKVK